MIASMWEHVATALGFGFPGGMEWIILLIIGLLIFGRRLPEVGRSLGRGIVEFKRGIKGIDDEIEEESSRSGARQEPPSLESSERPELRPPAEPTVSQDAAKREAGDDRGTGHVEAGSAPEPDRASG